MAGARLSRRAVIAGAAASAWAGAAFAADSLGAVEGRIGGRLGVAALDLGDGRRLAHRADERFPMCSTFKAMAAAAVLSRVDAGADTLDRFIPYGPADLFSYAPVTKAHVGDGGMKLGDLCAAAVELSDNTAANLILAAIGGPPGWTRFVRGVGDPVSRLDRNEPTLNSAIPGDPRDTTSPAAALEDLRRVVLGDVLKPASRERLQGWMIAGKTGAARLRAGLPPAWRVGDKTGTGDHATTNDIAVVWTPTAPIVIACYVTGAETTSNDVREAAIAEVGRLVAGAFRPAEARRG
jgi:beta-lactamase class A